MIIITIGYAAIGFLLLTSFSIALYSIFLMLSEFLPEPKKEKVKIPRYVIYNYRRK